MTLEQRAEARAKEAGSYAETFFEEDLELALDALDEADVTIAALEGQVIHLKEQLRMCRNA